MGENKTNPKVDAYFARGHKWQAEMLLLRRLLLSCPLNEELKWGRPCYTFGGHNVVIIQEFKDYCALLFVKGALLTDDAGLLIQQTANVRAARQLRFTRAAQITDRTEAIKLYVSEAIEVEKAGREVDLAANPPPAVPAALQRKFSEIPGMQDAFQALTPGRQRAYLLHFSSPKQEKTREERVEKCVPQILAGKGLDD